MPPRYVEASTLAGRLGFFTCTANGVLLYFSMACRRNVGTHPFYYCIKGPTLITSSLPPEKVGVLLKEVKGWAGFDEHTYQVNVPNALH